VLPLFENSGEGTPFASTHTVPFRSLGSVVLLRMCTSGPLCPLGDGREVLFFSLTLTVECHLNYTVGGDVMPTDIIIIIITMVYTAQGVTKV